MVLTLFTVLKIIGIVILVLLGLILFVLLLVLFVPVRYRGSGSYQNGTFMTTLRGSWLLHIVSVMGAYQNGQELHLVLRIFGIPFFDTFRNKKAKPTKTKGKPTGEIQAASSEKDDSGYWGSEETFQEKDFQEESFDEDSFQEENFYEDSSQEENSYQKYGQTVKKPNIIKKLRIFLQNL